MDYAVQRVTPDIGCPPTIEVRETLRAPTGFEAANVAFTKNLRAVRVSVGDPAERVELAPSYTLAGTELTQEWELTPYRTTSEPSTVRCEHGSTSALQRQLDSGLEGLRVQSSVAK